MFFFRPGFLGLFADRFGLFEVVLVGLAEFQNEGIGLAFSIGGLVFGVVDVSEVFVEVGLANLAVVGAGFCEGKGLG